jgi:hypothetical protein
VQPCSRVAFGLVLAAFVIPPSAWAQAQATRDLAGPIGVSPGGRDTFLAAAACPTFGWAAAEGAVGNYELVVYPADEESDGPALQATLPAGALGWTPPADRCLAPGRYAWSVRAMGFDRAGAWSEALLFQVRELPAEAELQAALEVVRRYLGTARVGEQLSGEAVADVLPTRALAATDPPQPRPVGNEPSEVPVGGGPATAVRGEVPDVAGETYGVHGVSNSADGAGVRADNNNAMAPDLVLGGSQPAEVTEFHFSRDSAMPVTFDFNNPGPGTMTVQVDGAAVATADTIFPTVLASDGSGSTLDADLLDGSNSSAFAGSVHTHSGTDITSGTVAEPRIDALVARDAEVLPVVLAGDGSGSTLDGDLLDGLDSTAFLASGTDDWVNETGDTMTGLLAMDPSSGFALQTGSGDSINLGGDLFKSGTRFLHSPGGSGTNVGLGANALLSSTTGLHNTALGSSALAANNGYNNTASGSGALYYNTTGSDNTAGGFRALRNNTTGFRNTASGYLALTSNTEGSFNTAGGALTLGNNFTGSNNVALGYRAGINTNGSSNVLISNEGVNAENNTLRLGTTGTGARQQNRAFVAAIRGTTTGAADAIAVLIDSNGQLGTTSSSRRFKQDIEGLGENSERLLALHPVKFRYKDHAAQGDTTPQYGLIAEEVAEVFPELVVYDPEGRPETVRYHLLAPLLLAELQRQSARWERRDADQEERIRALLTRLAVLEMERRSGPG